MIFIQDHDRYPLKMSLQTKKYTFYVKAFESYRITYIRTCMHAIACCQIITTPLRRWSKLNISCAPVL